MNKKLKERNEKWGFIKKGASAFSDSIYIYTQTSHNKWFLRMFRKQVKKEILKWH